MTNLEQTFLESATRYFREFQSKEIDWEQRRYEIAKAAMQGYISIDMGESHCVDEITYSMDAAKFAVLCADALIEELKKK